jgi:hypothetical protein
MLYKIITLLWQTTRPRHFHMLHDLLLVGNSASQTQTPNSANLAVDMNAKRKRFLVVGETYSMYVKTVFRPRLHNDLPLYHVISKCWNKKTQNHCTQ